MQPVVAVAVSGGRDSLALLHATVAFARTADLEVVALHIDHGLQSDSAAWARRVRELCGHWSIGCIVKRLVDTPAAGDSVEAWARRERYAALAAMAQAAGAGLVLLGHHRRDQAETFLLQALRGAGPRGLAAMPKQIERHGIAWARPWLDAPRETIEAYVDRHGIVAIDDPSNDDARYARNRLRHTLMPALAAAFDGAEQALAQAARRAAEATALLDEIAAEDLRAVGDGAALQVSAWSRLSPARRRNALEAWLRERLGHGAPYRLVDRLMNELDRTGPATWPAGCASLRRYRGRLTVAATRAAPRPSTALPVGFAAAGRYPIAAWHGALELLPAEQGGIALARLAQCELRPRTGGERFQRAPGTPPRSLKKQFQGAAVDVASRAAPLLYGVDGSLLFVPGLGIDARAWGVPAEPQVRLVWSPDSAPRGAA